MKGKIPSEIIIGLYCLTNPLGQQGQLIINVPAEGIADRIFLIVEKFHPDDVGNLKHQADLALRIAALDLLQGSSGNSRPPGQLFLGHLAFFSGKADEFAQQLNCVPGLAEICAVYGRGHKSKLSIIVIIVCNIGYNNNQKHSTGSCSELRALGSAPFTTFQTRLNTHQYMTVCQTALNIS